jgi:hypothetical protein
MIEKYMNNYDLEEIRNKVPIRIEPSVKDKISLPSLTYKITKMYRDYQWLLTRAITNAPNKEEIEKYGNYYYKEYYDEHYLVLAKIMEQKLVDIIEQLEKADIYIRYNYNNSLGWEVVTKQDIY